MIKRLFWMIIGIAVGAYAMRALTRAKDAMAPRRLASALGFGGSPGSVSGVRDEARSFLDDVRAFTLEREDELYASLGLDAARDDPRRGGAETDGTGGGTS